MSTTNVPLYMKINGADLAVSVTGNGILLIWGHGMMSSMEAENLGPFFNWEGLAQIANVTRYDARGHGRSGGSSNPVDYTWYGLAKDMIAIADHLQLDTFVAAGDSMGSATAIYTALANPDRIRALVLAIPPTGWESRGTQAAVYEQMAALIETRGNGALLQMMAKQAENASPTLAAQAAPQMVMKTIEWLTTCDAATLASILRGAKLSNLPDREQLRSISAPALILTWEGDPTHPVSTAEELHNLLPNSKLDVARNASDLSKWPGLLANFLESL